MTLASIPRPSNQLLQALPPDERQRLQPQLEWVSMPAGTVLHEAGAVLRHVYFPATSIVSLVSSMQDGAAAEVAVVGNEGVVGVCAFMGAGWALSAAIVQTGGDGWRMPAPVLAQHAQRSPALLRQLLGYTQLLLAQMAQNSACHRHHALEQQLCRWLLQQLDRLHGGTQLLATQEGIAALLGVRREGVTGAALRLQKAGLIRYGRGRIEVLDRAGLESRCCECHGVLRRVQQRWTAQQADAPWQEHAAA